MSTCAAPSDITRAVTACAQAPNGGLIVLPAPTTVIHRDLIANLPAQHRLPAVYNERGLPVGSVSAMPVIGLIIEPLDPPFIRR